jgi:hypothetical protein
MYSYYNTNLLGILCKHQLRSKSLINCNNICRTVQIKVFCMRIQTATFLKLVQRLELSLNFNDINTRSRSIKQVIVTFRYHESERLNESKWESVAVLPCKSYYIQRGSQWSRFLQ